jgi:elongation factor P
MIIQATQIRSGTLLMYEGQLWRAMTVNHVTPGNWRGMVQVKMRNIMNGSQTEHRFSSNEKVEKASLDTHEMQYLYSDSAGHHFMNTENYEQTALSEEVVGDSMKYLLPDSKISIDFYEGNPVGIELPTVIQLKVVDTQPTMKGATASASYKPAKMETGLEVNVPQFIQVGDVLNIDTRDDSYIDRA